MKKTFTITVLSEDRIGLLSRIAAIFVRRRIPMVSMNGASSGVEGVYRFTIVINETEELTHKLVQQIDKQVDVFKAFFHPDEEIVWTKQVVYKVNNTLQALDGVVKNYGLRCVYSNKSFTVLEATGIIETAHAITAALKQYGIVEMAEGGRVAI